MKKLFLLPLLAAIVAMAAFTSALAAGPIVVGPIAVTGQDDVGTCNNTWAEDSFNKTYTITNVSGNTYSVHVVYTNGTFVTNAGYSPGACEVTGGNGPGNGNTVGAGITGTFTQVYDGTVTGTLSGNSCTPAICVDTTSILNTVFNTGWTWTILSDGGHWTWINTYQAGPQCTWFDTQVNWPHNDTGDITGVCPPAPTSTPRPLGVGGKILPPAAAVADASGEKSGGSGESAATWIVLATAIAGVLATGGWYARRRWLS